VAIRSTADEFLDDVLRAVATEALSLATATAREIHAHEQEPWSAAMAAGCDELRRALRGSAADAVLRWWRDGVSPIMHGRPFVLEPPGQACALCVAQLAGLDGGQLEATGDDEALTIRGSRGYYDIVCRPGAMRSDVERRARARVARRRRNGPYDPGTPVWVVIHGAAGTFPALDAKPDISASEPTRGNIAGGEADDIFVVKAEHALDGRLAA
jgi:hypothetical protein